jgi:CRP/FNR family cyclic AMP-dependent transcriptional regulator
MTGRPDSTGSPDCCWPLLATIPAAEREALVASARPRRYRRRQSLMREGEAPDGFHLVRAGHVAIQRTLPSGVVGTLGVFGPGTVVGELAILSPAPRNSSVVALDEVETFKLAARDLDELRRAHPAIDRFLVGALTAEVRRLSGLIMEAHYLDAESRVRHRLNDLIRLFRDTSGPVEIPVTQEELAHMAGTTRATTNRVLRAAAARGELRLTRSAMIVDATVAGTA